MHVIHRGGLSYAVILLSGLVVACGTTNVGATYVDEVLASGPTLYWRLDDTTAGVGGALDSSGRGNHGNHFGFDPIEPSNGNGMVGVPGFELLDLPGNLGAEFVADDVILAGGPDIDVPETGAYSIELFFKPSSLNATSAQELAAKGPNTGIQTWYLLYFGPNGFGIPTGTLRFGVNGQGTGPQAMDAANTLASDSWAYIVATYDTDPGSLEANLYVNGQLSVTQTFDPAGPLSPGEAFIAGGLDQGGIVNTANGTIDEVAYYAKALSAAEVQAHYEAAVGPPVPGDPFAWNRADGGSWFVSANWKPEEPSMLFLPDSEDSIATLGDAIEADSTIFVDQDVTLNIINFDNTNSYIVAGSRTVNLSNGAELGDPEIGVVQGAHQFQANVALNANTAVDIASGATLEFNNRLNLNGNTLTKTGSGTLAINNNVLTSGGMVDCQAGICSGTGTISGSLNNDGTVAPGNSAGSLTIDGNMTQGETGTLELEIGGTVAGDEHDKLNVTGQLDLNGTVAVALINDYMPAGGETFDLVDFGSFVDSGFAFDFSLAALTDGLEWITTDFATNGTLSIMGGEMFPDGDFDASGTTEVSDLNLVLFNWNKMGSELPGTWAYQRPGDTDIVGVPQLNAVLFNWNAMAPSAAVPEPVSSVVLSIGMLVFAIGRSEVRNVTSRCLT